MATRLKRCNARTDLYLGNIGDEAARFEETIVRGKAYRAAGADCVYPISLRDPRTIERLVEALDRTPINVNVRAGSPSVTELEALGVARASTASQMAVMTMRRMRRIAEELRRIGRFDALDPEIAQAEAQQLFAPG
jgi:2-methylisocitrate lyase-like PEP mutase family enzyme